MDTNALKKFAQEARNQLRKEVGARLQQLLLTDSVEAHEKAAILEDLKKRISDTSQDRVIEEVAYTWFNRLCALRYMDLNGFNRIGVVSPASGATQPEILQEAKAGYVDETLPVKRKQLQGYLSGSLPADNPQQEAYRLLLVAVCNNLAESMPFLFEPIEDYSELLMPVDLLSESSILYAVRQALTPEACQDVEVIGWLYQFYISEKKDQVMAQKGAVPSEDIPAVTQLFTPHWIVRYMVENSLGRLWLLNHPHSRLAEKMEYYIDSTHKTLTPHSPLPEGEGPGVRAVKVSSPEDLRLCDPACGSGHILTYAFDLLYAIYEEAGYDPAQIPALIIEHNLYGIEIDQRAGSLAAFALYMKAFEKDRRFARRGVTPNICVLEDVSFSAAEIKTYMQRLGEDLFTQDLWEGLKQFEQASTYGALIRPRIRQPQAVRERMRQQGVFADLFLNETNRKVEKVLEMAEYLSSRYQVVVANPPYMGSNNMNDCLKAFAKLNYPTTKADTYSMFMERSLSMILEHGFVGMITIPNWMFLSSFEDFRFNILSETTISSLIHNGRGVWGSDFGSCSFVLEKKRNENQFGYFRKLFINQGEVNSNEAISRNFFDTENYPAYYVNSKSLKKIPGAPIAYWVSDSIINIFSNNKKISEIAEPRQGTSTGDNEKFLRLWFEVNSTFINFSCRNQNDSLLSQKKWYPATKGGEFRKWFGNNDYLVNWKNNGYEIQQFPSSAIRNPSTNFKEAITWTGVSASKLGVRFCESGFVFTISGKPVVCDDSSLLRYILAFLATKITFELLLILTPTISFEVGYIAKLPIIIPNKTLLSNVVDITNRLIFTSKTDWDTYETSWDFQRSPLLPPGQPPAAVPLSRRYAELRAEWQRMTNETQRLEEENNRIFIEAYGLQDELTPDVPLSEITLTCNPHYRYPDNARRQYTPAEREALLLEDTMKEFISYAVGCMFGRYALEKPGLILANQGESVEDYERALTPSPLPEGEGLGVRVIAFPPDEDNIIPILEGDWFPDDITNRFKAFLRVTFGAKNYEENLAFIESALGKDLRAYFTRDFYKDHLQTYKQRPIYWLFSSPKGSFNALIYMHRYRPDTLSVLLNKYLREYQNKLRARRGFLETIERDTAASKKDKTAALKEIRQIESVLAELRDYENEVIYPLAAEQLSIDLDDGVKVNYAKFGKALKAI